MSKMQELPAKNMTQTYLCDKQEMLLLEPFFDEVVCYAFAFNHVSKTDCPFGEIVPGIDSLPRSKYIGKVNFNGVIADQYELLTFAQRQYHNETWVLKDNQYLAYMESSNISDILRQTYIFSNIEPVTDDDFAVSDDC